jgi:N-methylhydantoinase B
MDPIVLSIVWKNLVSISQEMGAVLKRTAFSPALREAGDFSASIHDAAGEIVANGLFSPGHTGAALRGVPELIRRLDTSSLRPGDAILYNDLDLSLGHLPDVFSVSPIFVDDEILAYAVTSAHHVDVGGLAPGSIAIEGVRDVYAEGLRIPPIKYFVEGRPNRYVFEMIRANSRLPDHVEGDLQAQMNANRRGTDRFLELVDRYGAEAVRVAMDEILRHTEASFRRAIERLPDGRYEFADQMDDYGPGTEALPLNVALDVIGDELVIDFAGSAPQVAAGMNSYLGFTTAYTLYAVKAVLDPHGEPTGGMIRPITITAPEGCFVNPNHPAPGGGRAVVLTRVVDAVIGALAKAAPDVAVAAPSQFMNSAFGSASGRPSEQFVYFELLFGGTGARPDGDGNESMCAGLDVNNIPVEAYETTSPMLVERLEVLPDTGGPGRHRGGCGIRKDIRVLQDMVTMTNMGDRTASAPYGLEGGRPGAIGETVLESGGSTTALQSKGTYIVNRGDLVSMRLSGGGGYGDPYERDPNRVLDDVREGLVTAEGARRDYGVAVAPDLSQVDDESTARLRRSRHTVGS